MVSKIQVNDQLSGEQSISSDHVIVTIEDVNRVLEVGRLLFSVLTTPTLLGRDQSWR